MSNRLWASPGWRPAWTEGEQGGDMHGTGGCSTGGGDGAGPATARTAWTAGTEAAAGVCVWCVLVCVAECG